MSLQQDFDQNKLEEEMRKRKERVEKWREEQRKKAIENIGEIKKELEEMKQGKKWSLEDDDGESRPTVCFFFCFFLQRSRLFHVLFVYCLILFYFLIRCAPDDDEDNSAPMEEDEDAEGEEKDDKDTDPKEESKDGGDEETETAVVEEAQEDDIDPLDAYMEEVKQEVKKFNMGGVNDRVTKATGRHTEYFHMFECLMARPHSVLV